MNNHHNNHHGKVNAMELIGHVAVDSGQVTIVDPCYFMPGRDGYNSDALKGVFYEDVCAVTLSEPRAGQYGGLAVVSESGYGDGYYPVYADRDSSGRIVRLTIEFDSDRCDGCHEEDCVCDDEEDER